MQTLTAKKLIKMTNELYENEAASFDQTRKNLWEKEILDFVGKIKPGSSVLDLGCGNARLLSQTELQMTHRCLQMKIEYLGIDTSRKLITLNKKKYSDANFRVGDGLSIKYKNKFDYIISIAVLHHIPSEDLQIKFLKNICSALKPKGKTLITVWNRWQTKINHKHTNLTNNTNEIDKKILLDLNINDQIVPWKQSGQFRYIHAFKPDELKNLAQKAGFKKIKVFASRMGKITNLDEALNIYLEAQK